ncbi:MAG: EpsD family peptidyl-prolyl cis-trans isomerase [Pseudomonadota bacterium]
MFYRTKETRKGIKPYYSAILIMAVAMYVTGCDKKPTKNGQAIAKVNGQEITVHQLNQELARLPGANEKQVLELLINRQLVINAAIENKLDRDAAVMQSMERAKSEVLTQAYLQNKLSTLAKPSTVEIEDFYTKHPEFFGQRKLFETKEIVLAKKDMTDALKKDIELSNNVDDIKAQLDKKGIKYVARQLSRTTMDIPLEMASKWQVLQRGDKIFLADGNYATVVLINEIKDSPVTKEAAIPQIEQYLRNTKAKNGEQAELAKLRKEAKIEYLNSADKVIEKPVEKSDAANQTETKPTQEKPY